jgi:Phosphotransferase enzyme family
VENLESTIEPDYLPVVDSVTDVTPEWLSGVLSREGRDVRVQSLTATPVGTGQMGSTFRIAADCDGADMPLNLVIKLPASPGEQNPLASGQRCEAAFYREMAGRVLINTPRCYHAAANDTGTRFTVLLADASPAQQGDQIAGCTLKQATAAASAVAGLHAPTWCDPSLDELDWVVSGRPTAATAAGLAPMLGSATTSFIEQLKLSAAATRALRRSAETAPIWGAGRPTPFALCHGDYRLDNLLFPPIDRPDDAVLVIDWAVMSVGLPQRDLALLLAPGLQTPVRRRAERALVDAYFQRLVELGVTGYTSDACWDDYRLGLFYNVIVTVLGWAFSRRTQRGDEMFRLMAERTTLALVDNDSFGVL